MPNIFTISPYMCLEDRFTLYWEYLIHHNPDIGQEITNYIADQTDISRSKFIKCQDHPYYNGVDLPDLLLVCEDYDLICEHKIDSPLGDRQLQRYCDLKPEKKSYVILISNSGDMAVDQEVLEHPKYLHPKNSSCQYFLWENFYPIIKRHQSHLAIEFCEYMKAEGMTSWDFEDWSDPFTDDVAKEQFREVWSSVIDYFKNIDPPARVCKRDPYGLGLQVQKPHPDIRLIYFDVAKKPLQFDTGFSGRGINMKVYGHKDDSNMTQQLPEVEEEIITPDDMPNFHVRSVGNLKPVSGGYILLREYAVSLDYILTDNITLAKERLVDFVRICKEHLDNTIENL